MTGSGVQYKLESDDATCLHLFPKDSKHSVASEKSLRMLERYCDVRNLKRVLKIGKRLLSLCVCAILVINSSLDVSDLGQDGGDVSH